MQWIKKGNECEANICVTHCQVKSTTGCETLGGCGNTYTTKGGEYQSQNKCSSEHMYGFYVYNHEEIIL